MKTSLVALLALFVPTHAFTIPSCNPVVAVAPRALGPLMAKTPDDELDAMLDRIDDSALRDPGPTRKWNVIDEDQDELAASQLRELRLPLLFVGCVLAAIVKSV